MRSRIDLEKAAAIEVFGALAVSADRKHRRSGVGRRSTSVQNRALYHLVRSLVHIAREAGAEQKRITRGKVSFELRGNGTEEILSIRTGASS